MASRASTFWAFIVVLILLHLTLRLALGLTMIPDLLIVAALLGARRLGGAGSAFLGLVLGVLADSLAIVVFGATAVAFVVVCYLGSRTRNVFEGDSYLFVAVYTFIGAWLILTTRFLLTRITQDMELSLLITAAPLESLYIAIAAVLSLVGYRAVTGHR